jgi:hypothetical protein
MLIYKHLTLSVLKGYSAVHRLKLLQNVFIPVEFAHCTINVERRATIQKDDADAEDLSYLLEAGNRTIRSMARIDKEVDQHIRQHAAPACLSLCNAVQDKLPRELRDVIYRYILREPKIVVMSNHLLQDRFDKSIMIRSRAYRWSKIWKHVHDYTHLCVTETTRGISRDR